MKASFSSHTEVLPSGALVETGTITFQGKDFSATGSVIDEAAGFVLGYPKRLHDGRHVLTTWDGAPIATVALKGRWKQWGFGAVENEIFAWRAIIAGRIYSGRNGGPGMYLRMRAGRTLSAPAKNA